MRFQAINKSSYIIGSSLGSRRSEFIPNMLGYQRNINVMTSTIHAYGCYRPHKLHQNAFPLLSTFINNRCLSNGAVDKTTDTFNNAVRLLQSKQSNSNVDVSNEDKLAIYGLFKQATHGPSLSSVTGRPGMFDMVGRAKFDAWKSYDNLSKHDSMEKYINKIQDVLKLSRSDIESSVVQEQPANTSSDTSPTSTPPKATIYDVFYPRTHGRGSYHNQNLATILTTVADNSIATMTLNRPKRGNAFNFQMWNDYRTAFDAVRNDDTCRVLILTGVPGSKAFSTGMDLDVFAQLPKLLSTESCEGRKREAIGYFIQYLQDAVSEPEVSPIPVIAKIAGHCIGGALDIITACDIRYCTKDSTFSIKETDLAMVADIGTLQRLPGIIGQQRCRELAYTARTFTGKEAEAMGLVAQCFDSEEEMEKHVLMVAETIAKKSPLTIRGVKKSILYTREHSTNDSLEQVKLWNMSILQNNDLQEAFKAMLTKSTPHYTQP